MLAVNRMSEQEEMLKRIAVKWGARWISQLVSDMQLRRKGLSEYTAAGSQSKLPRQRMIKSPRQYMVEHYVGNGDPDAPCDQVSLYSIILFS